MYPPYHLQNIPKPQLVLPNGQKQQQQNKLLQRQISSSSQQKNNNNIQLFHKIPQQVQQLQQIQNNVQNIQKLKEIRGLDLVQNLKIKMNRNLALNENQFYQLNNKNSQEENVEDLYIPQSQKKNQSQQRPQSFLALQGQKKNGNFNSQQTIDQSIEDSPVLLKQNDFLEKRNKQSEGNLIQNNKLQNMDFQQRLNLARRRQSNISHQTSQKNIEPIQNLISLNKRNEEMQEIFTADKVNKKFDFIPKNIKPNSNSPNLPQFFNHYSARQNSKFNSENKNDWNNNSYNLDLPENIPSKNIFKNNPEKQHNLIEFKIQKHQTAFNGQNSQYLDSIDKELSKIDSLQNKNERALQDYVNIREQMIQMQNHIKIQKPQSKGKMYRD